MYPHGNHCQWAGPAGGAPCILFMHSSREMAVWCVCAVAGRVSVDRLVPKIQTSHRGQAGHAPFLFPDLTVRREARILLCMFPLLKERRVFFPVTYPCSFWGLGTQMQNNRLGRATLSIAAIGAFSDRPPCSPWVTCPCHVLQRTLNLTASLSLSFGIEMTCGLLFHHAVG